MKRTVNVHHLTRVEGHGNIRVEIEGGKLIEARWDVVETPRFFEAMLQGKHYVEAGMLSARICGICSISHCLASLIATERAFGLAIPPAARELRLLAKHAETLQSHWLHLLFLAAPDFLGLGSVIPLIELRPEVVDLAGRLKGLANRICDVVAGRTTHPVSLQVGGVAIHPERVVLLDLRDALKRSLEDIAGVAALVADFEIPDFTRETEFVSLQGVDDYPFLGERVVSTDGVERSSDEYLELTHEYVNEHNTSKWARLSRSSFAVGPLARFNNSHRFLGPEAAELAERLGLAAVCHNPFMSHAARLVECVQVTHEAIALLDSLIEEGRRETMAPVVPRAGQGVGAVEAPRGILYHDFTYDGEGRIVRANCIIPTTQNNANIHHDLTALAERYAADDLPDRDLELYCSMLVRSYDPCISCSVH